jgi:hypothetical protein
VVNLVWRETNFCIDRFKPHENRFQGSRDIEESLWGVFLPPKATIKLAKPSATMRVNAIKQLNSKVAHDKHRPVHANSDIRYWRWSQAVCVRTHYRLTPPSPTVTPDRPHPTYPKRDIMHADPSCIHHAIN